MRLLLLAVVGLLAVRGSDAGCTVTNPTCYVDTASRILGHDNVNKIGSLSNEYCAQLCHNLGNTLAGTENGNECYCGNELASGAQQGSGCDSGCANYNQEKCGGTWRISVFKVQCSGAPQPPPPETPLMVNPCVNASSPFASMPFCNPKLPLSQRVDDAVSRLTLAEKICNLGTGGCSTPSLGLEAYNWWSEATHGVQSGRHDERTPANTNFPFPITTAMSFNRTLWTATGRQIAREARAMMNIGNGYSTFWAPVINLAREPRWGRNIETPGEDPYLTGQYAINFVRGFQNDPTDPTHLLASACIKHYVANSMESTTQNGVNYNRHDFDASVTLQDLYDSYLLPFQAGVEEGGVSSIMCSYNAVNGVPSCANPWLLTTLARDQWQFDGYITSDCDADSDVFNSHHYTATPEEAVRDVLRAGTDVDCGNFVPDNAQSALNKGVITEDDIDTRLRYLFRMRFRLLHFDPPTPLSEIPISTICSDEAIALSRAGASQSVTLIKNANKALPLSPSIGSAAVIGPNSNLSHSIAGYYGPSNVCNGPFNNGFNNMVDAVQQYVANTVTALGVPNVQSNDTSNIAAAVNMAKSVDTVVMAVGTDLSVAAEGHDTTSISFSDGQTQLIEAVAAAAKNPIILVILSAVPLDISAQLNNSKIGAIVHAGQPSVTTLGVGDVLFGKVVPAGRTIQTIYPASYANEVSIFDFGMRPGPSNYPRPDCPKPMAQCPNGTNPGRTHRFYTGTPVVPFGFGLSYTSFSYSASSSMGGAVGSLAAVRAVIAKKEAEGRALPRRADLAAPLVNFQVNVTNTGSIDADDVVLGFAVPPGAGTGGVPKQTLFGFERVFVKAGQTVTVNLLPNLDTFMHVRGDGSHVALAGDYTFRFGLRESSSLGMGFAELTARFE